RRSKPSWSGIIDMMNIFTDEMLPASGSAMDSTKQLQWLKTTLLAYSKTWPNVNPQLSSILKELVSQIRPFKKGELVAHLEGLLGEGFMLTQRCIEDWGGE